MPDTKKLSKCPNESTLRRMFGDQVINEYIQTINETINETTIEEEKPNPEINASNKS
jgi:hypothetical protein